MITPLHLLGFVSTEEDVVMDEKQEKRKINCGREKGKQKQKLQNSRYNNLQKKVLIINADPEKGLGYGFQQ